MTQGSNLEIVSMYIVFSMKINWFAQVDWHETLLVKLVSPPPPQENYIDNFWMEGIKKYSLVHFVLHI